jgi:hypothetical protein
MLGLVWRAATFWGRMTRRPSMITREAVANANDIHHFDGSKITRKLGFGYIPVSESIQQTAVFLKQDIQRSS